MKNTEIKNNTLTRKENEEEKVMKNTNIKEHEEKLMEVFSDFPETYDKLINMTSNSIADEVKHKIEQVSTYTKDDEKINAIARGSAQLDIQCLNYEREMIEDAINDGRIEHCEFIDGIIANIDKNTESLRAIRVEAGGYADDEHACRYVDDMFDAYSSIQEEINTLGASVQ